MKILVVSNTPWNTDNSFGNSYSNIFSGIEDLEFANIYCRYGNVNEKKVVKAFQITEKQLIKNLKNKNFPSGRETDETTETGAVGVEASAFKAARKTRFRIFALGRELIWKIGRWKSPELKKFIDDFKPDLIFQPVYCSGYINDIAMYCKKRTGARMLGYISDDCYTLKQLEFSPVYWIERLIKRPIVKRTIKNCEILYVISEVQKQEYEKIFKVPCKVLTKCEDFSQEPPEWELPKDTVRLMYAGNISRGREKSLSYISNAIERLNNEGFSISFDIYSRSLVDENKFSLKGTKLCGSAPYKEICKTQNEADIMIHAEGLSLKDRLEVRQSFSTKLVDFFKLGKCIFAVGSREQAFAKHLIDNDAAVVAENKAEVYQKLRALLENPQDIIDYGKKAYDCGRKYHSKEKTQKMLMEDLKNYAKE